MRVNCVDCLDRTNNSMAGMAAIILSQFLVKMKLGNLLCYVNKATGSVKD